MYIIYLITYKKLYIAFTKTKKSLDTGCSSLFETHSAAVGQSGNLRRADDPLMLSAERFLCHELQIRKREEHRDIQALELRKKETTEA